MLMSKAPKRGHRRPEPVVCWLAWFWDLQTHRCIVLESSWTIPPEAEDMDDIVAFPGDSRTARPPSLLLVLSIRFRMP
jgi:hypothetical protein